MKVLVTGGLGYIGSHTVVELVAAGYKPVIVDSLVNSNRGCLSRLNTITKSNIPFHQMDISDSIKMRQILSQEKITGVIHFAALKAVGESVAKPLSYYANNVSSTISFLGDLEHLGIRQVVFSSSATVYGNPKSVPISEDFEVHAINPYGKTKSIIEELGRDLCAHGSPWAWMNLRYFNPIGAHESGLIGEDPKGIPNNILPYIAKVAAGSLPELVVFGDDWATKDGTGVRDYIHVVDLAKGHIKALKYMERNRGEVTVNLGTGSGVSVLELISAFEKASGKKVPYRIGPRRQGDIAECFADSSKALKVLNWRTNLNLERMCQDSWRWQVQNQRGYE